LSQAKHRIENSDKGEKKKENYIELHRKKPVACLSDVKLVEKRDTERR